MTPEKLKEIEQRYLANGDALDASSYCVLDLIHEVRALRNRLSMATQFKIWQPDSYSPFGWISIHRCEGHRLPMQPYMWAVRMDGFTLSKSGEWEYEPIPSSRDDAYYSRCRYDSYEDAEMMARAAIDAARGGKP